MSQSLTVHGHNYHPTKQEFLTLKWVIAELFQKYLLWKLFTVKNGNNPLTYIMTTPNLDATQHHWVESLAGFTFSIEYQKGQDNAAADALSQVTSRLDSETMKSILDRVTVGLTGRADAHDPVVAETDEEICKQVHKAAVQARAAHTHVNLHVTDWVATQWEDPVLNSMINWIPSWKVQYLMFGCQPCLPFDFYFTTIRGIEKHWHVDYYIAEVHEQLLEAFKEAQVQSKSKAERQKWCYDRPMPFHWKQATLSWLKPMPIRERGKWRTSGRRNCM